MLKIFLTTSLLLPLFIAEESVNGVNECATIKREKNFISRLEELLEVPIDIVSTGPDREETMVLKNLF